MGYYRHKGGFLRQRKYAVDRLALSTRVAAPVLCPVMQAARFRKVLRAAGPRN